jgi:superoxide dismutase
MVIMASCSYNHFIWYTLWFCLLAAPQGTLHLTRSTRSAKSATSSASALSSASPQLYLRSLVLNNLMPAQTPPGSSQSLQSQIFNNYTSMLWTFQFSRSIMKQASSGLSGTIVLDDVVMVLPAVELQVSRAVHMKVWRLCYYGGMEVHVSVSCLPPI